jgi:hypothetical protein
MMIKALAWLEIKRERGKKANFPPTFLCPFSPH